MVADTVVQLWGTHKVTGEFFISEQSKSIRLFIDLLIGK